jgi:uncharacterized protein YdaU (DUF1376 family)
MHADPAPKVDVWMPWYVSDYLASTALFSTLESGAYSLLLMHMWEQGGTLPLDHERLARVAKVTDPDAWAAIWKEISVRFVPMGEGRFTHPKLWAKLQEARRLKTEASDRGRAGAAARWPEGRPRKPRARRARPAAQQQVQQQATASPVEPAAPPVPAPQPEPPAAPTDAGAHAQALPEHMPEQCSPPSPSKTDPDPERAHAPAEPEDRAGAWPEPKREPVRFNHGVVRARGQPPPEPSRQMQLAPARPAGTRPPAKPAPAGSVYARWVDAKWKPKESWPSREPGQEG